MAEGILIVIILVLLGIAWMMSRSIRNTKKTITDTVTEHPKKRQERSDQADYEYLLSLPIWGERERVLQFCREHFGINTDKLCTEIESGKRYEFHIKMVEFEGIRYRLRIHPMGSMRYETRSLAKSIRALGGAVPFHLLLAKNEDEDMSSYISEIKEHHDVEQIYIWSSDHGGFYNYTNSQKVRFPLPDTPMTILEHVTYLINKHIRGT